MLNRIAAAKKVEVERLKSMLDIDAIAVRTRSFDPFKVFKQEKGGPEIIAEVKKASPVKGVICRDFDHLDMARKYRENGAAAISVISDSQFFGGKSDYLRDIREEMDLPILRKDFIIDKLQLFETAEMGADMVLLIAALHDYPSLLRLCEKSLEIGLEPLLEVHNAQEAVMSLDLPVNMIGVNNRDLKSFTIDINTSLELSSLIPDSLVKVSESGIKSRQDLRLLQDSGFDAALIGEGLAAFPDPGARLHELLQYREVKGYDQS